jgi:flagellar hook assembly protein FlgD
MRVMLTDVDANKTVYMRTTAQYTFHTATSGTTLRHLQITVESGSGAGLVLSAASARAAGSRVTVSYTASAPCSVTATVLNIAGRSVRVLASGATAAAGVNTLSWDGRSTSGSLVPAGIYLVQLDAVADDGQRVRSVTQLNLSGRR